MDPHTTPVLSFLSMDLTRLSLVKFALEMERRVIETNLDKLPSDMKDKGQMALKACHKDLANVEWISADMAQAAYN